MKREELNLNDYDQVIFDLGGVILNLEYERTTREFKKSIPALEESTFLGKENQLPFFSDYETGKISSAVFQSRFESHYHTTFSAQSFADCWNAMLLDFPLERIHFLKRLRAQKKVFLLSNINELHEVAVEERFSRLQQSFSFSSLFDRVYYSHHLGLRKPDSAIFELIIREQSLDKSRTLFIDDSLQHVVGAKACGIPAFHLQKPLTLEFLM